MTVHLEDLVTEPTLDDIEIGDAFGEALLRERAAHGQSLVHERDDGNVSVETMFGYFLPRKAWSERCRWCVDRTVGRVLDIGAGAGRAALALQEAGAEVVALDTSPGAIAVSVDRGVHEVFLGTVADLADCSPRPFDSLLFLGNTLGILTSDQETAEMLEVLRTITTKGALLVGTGADPTVDSAIYDARYRDRNERLGRDSGLARVRSRIGRISSPWYDLRFRPLADLVDVCAAGGWSLVEVHEGTQYAVVLRRD